MSTLGNRIATLQKINNISNKDLALALKVSCPTITNWKNGSRSPDLSNIVSIAEYFNCSTDFLLGRTNDVNNYLSIESNGIIYELTYIDISNIIIFLDSIGFDILNLIKKIQFKDIICPII